MFCCVQYPPPLFPEQTWTLLRINGSQLKEMTSFSALFSTLNLNNHILNFLLQKSKLQYDNHLNE